MTAQLLTDIEAFLERRGMAPSTFGAMFNDRHLVRQIRLGRRVWPENEKRIRSKMAELDAPTPELAAQLEDPDARRVVTCSVCERRLGGHAAAACQMIDCPQHEAAAA